jgi:type IV pilus assembly protein PilA
LLIVIAIPQFNSYKQRAYDTDSKANLHNIFLACKAYWADYEENHECTVLISKNGYGFNESTNVTITPYDLGTETGFAAMAKHSSSSNIFSMDANGNITKNETNIPNFIKPSTLGFPIYGRFFLYS